MRNKVKQTILFCFCLLASIVSRAQDTSWYSDSETTFTLTTKEQFLGFKDLVNSGKTFEGKTVKLETDIVLNDFSELSINSESLMEWDPIGTTSNPFKGTLNGDGHTIYGVYINNSNRNYVGLFGYVEKGTIQNLCLNNSYICAYKFIGGIVGKCSQGTIDKCMNKSSITINYDCGGGICGYIEKGTISKCCNYGDIVCSSSYGDVGGIVGYAGVSDIYNCANYAIIKVEKGTLGSSRTGGIVGWFYNSSYDTNSYHYISNCYNKGAIHGKVTCGGIVGYSAGGKGIVYHSINYGTVSVYYKNGEVGAIIASNNKTHIGGCYYLDTSCVMDERNTSGTLKTESQLKSQDFLDQFNSTIETFTNSTGLQHDSWKFGKDGYPILYLINEDEPDFIEIKSLVLPEIVTAKVNKSTTVELTCFPFFAKKDLQWESADEQVALIDQDGNITGVGPGQTEITVTDQLTNMQATCTVSVIMEVGDTFNADMSNGTETVSTTFMLTDLENRYVSLGDGTNAAIATATTGGIVIPETIVGPGNNTYTVKTIGSNAFASSQISSVTIPQEIKIIGNNAFYSCNSLTSVTVESLEPLTINSTCFSKYAAATLNVPKGCYEVYKIADVWKGFGKIIEPNHKSGESFIASITAGSGRTNARFLVIDAANKYVSVGNGEVPSIADDTSGSIVIPSTVTGYDGRTYQVKQISDLAFFDCYELTSIGLPSGITAIGRASFYDCAGLTSFTIPSTVTSLGDRAFCICYNLASINIPSSVTSIGEAAFYGCSKLNSVTVNWSEPIAIDNNCFTNAKNATLNVPKGSYEIYAGAENWKDFNTIKEPAHSVGETFVAYVMVDGVKTNARYKVTNATSKYVNIGNGEECAISDFTTGNVVVPSSVTGYDGQIYQVKQVAPAAFFGCTEVTSIEVPSGITTFGQAAFYQCSAITSFDIPTTVTSIGEGAFSYCENLQEILIPKNVKSIGTNAFAECGNLTSVTVEWATPITISNDCFSNAANATLFVPCETKELYGSANGWKMFKEIVELYKDGDVFKELTDGGVEMTFKVISAADKTCQVGTGNDSERAINKTTVGAITIPEIVNNLTVIGIASYAFKECTSLTSVIIPNSVTELGEQSFILCEGLTNIDIPNTVTNIGANAFRYCYALKTITIPSSVISIGLAAFASNKDLESIVVESGNTIYDSRDNCNAIICTATNELISGCKETIIPNSVTSIGRSAFNGCYNLSGITIPSSITTIEQRAFYDCTGLTDVYIPNSVTSIGQYAFENCSSLTDVYIPNSVTSIGQYAFQNCGNLTSVTVEWDEPISIGTNCFSNAANAALYVPVGTNSKYKAATGWKNFGQIVNKTDNILFVRDFEEAPRGGRILLPIELNNNDVVAGCSFTLVLPEGMTFVTNNVGQAVYRMNEERLASNAYTIIPNVMNNRECQFRVMPTTPTTTINGTEGILFSVKVDVNMDLSASDYYAKMKDVMLSIPKEEVLPSSFYLLDQLSKVAVSRFVAGDVNHDGGDKPDLTDAIIIVFRAFDKSLEVNETFADLNADGEIDLTDAIIVVFKSFGNDNEAAARATSIIPN